MVDEVKLDKIGTYYFTDNNIDKKNKLAVDSSTPEEITVTNHLNELVKSINHYEEPLNVAALNDIKHKLQHNEYQIDFDLLSEKLLSSGILSVGD